MLKTKSIMTFKDWLKTIKYKKDNPLSFKKLNCTFQGLTDLKGIEEFKNLEYLYCSNNYLTSLKGIENLINLKELDCSYNGLIDLKGIEKLSNLKILFCSGNNLEHKHYYDFNSVKYYQRYLKSFYRKDKIKNLI